MRLRLPRRTTTAIRVAWLEDNQLRYDDHDTEAAANAHAARLRTRRKTPITYVLSNFERNPA